MMWRQTGEGRRKENDMDNKSTAVTSGIGFCGLLTIAFIVLKLTHVINWSWIWVLSPLWIEAILAILLFIIILVVALISSR